MSKVAEKDLLAYVAEKSGQDIYACYHCRKCSIGCPVVPFMDIAPDVVHRMLRYGDKEEVLKSSTIWLCAACEICGARCPNDIDISKVMDVLKQLAVREGYRGEGKAQRVFHEAFLSGVKKRGRMHEVSLVRDLKLKTGGFFKDWKLGLRMFRLGKLPLKAEKIENIGEMRKLFDEAERDG